jgi:glycosyltransferase involved in cell wall biosynthesis
MSKKVIYCLAENAFQSNPNDDMSVDLAGGGELWLADFITLLKNLDYEVRLFQFSYFKITKNFRGHRIKGLGNMDTKKTFSECMTKGLNDFKELSKDGDGIFLLSMNLSGIKFDIPTLAVSHGVIGDNNIKDPELGKKIATAMKHWIGNSTRTISVDTNSIHIMQLLNPIESQKMLFVPNYVDTDRFTYKEKDYSGKFKVLFARRIAPERGYIQMAKACEILSEKYDDIEFTFCGKGHPQEEANLHSIIDKLSNVKHISLEHKDMHTIYDGQHVSVVPTTCAEGTSLSCIESVVTGTVPISSYIGGLTDIVTHLFNGVLISPNSVEEIVNAIEYLYHNRDELEVMKDNCLRMASSFSKKRWESQISSIIKSIYGNP